jgi:serine phosphatase RsbU (regulator of sigma subunit)
MPDETLVRVVIAGYEVTLRDHLGAAIHKHSRLRLVGEAENGREAIELCELARPDVTVLDLDMPKSEALLTARAIRQRWPEIQVVMLAGSSSDERLHSALQAGAWEYILKEAIAESAATVILRTQKPYITQPAFNARFPSQAEPLTQSFAAIPQRTMKELEMAGRVQAGILPAKPPTLAGWDIAARLLSAHETSGDFYDFIPLSNGKWAIVIADVTDKGIGAAVFMALCSTLIRTYADRYYTLPAIAINSVNERIFSDTRGNLYVTVFYGILEPEIGRLRYVNAGHNPPLLVSGKRSKGVDRLQRTGIALGVTEDATWQQKIIKFISGDMLLLYTDGVTEAQDAQGRFFGEARLIELVRSVSDRPAQQVLETVIAELERFTHGSGVQDDTTLVILTRK